MYRPIIKRLSKINPLRIITWYSDFEMEIKTTDLIANFFKSKGINQVFGVTGGAAVHLFDSYKKKILN